MPIQIAPAPDLTTIGPGLPIQLQSTFIGPFPSDAQWHLDINLDADFNKPFLGYNHPCTGPIVSMTMLTSPDWNEQRKGWTPIENRIVYVEARITTNTGTIDSGTRSDLHWDTQTGLGYQIRALAGQGQTQGGFTAEDRALLTTTEQRTTLLGEVGQLIVQTASGPLPFTLADLFSRNSLDRLIFEEMTNGPTCTPVRINLAPIAQYAITVRVTTIPDDIVFKTPDGEWAFPDLAVLRIFRGQDLMFRRGIHEPTFETEAPWEWGANILNKNLLGVPPPATRVWVDWRDGCCGQVFIRHMP